MAATIFSEARLIEEYWQDVRGLLCKEVPIGGNVPGVWPERSRFRRLDGVRFQSIDGVDDGIVFYGRVRRRFAEWAARYPVELIEAKRRLNRTAIGQIIAGVDMFQHQYQPLQIMPVIVCTEGDPALAWVCERRRIQVRIVAV